MSEPRAEFVELRGNRVLRVIPRVEVIRLHAADKYVTVYSGGQQVLIADSLAQLQREGMDGFFRCHRAHLVRLDLITHVDRDPNRDCWLHLQGCPERLPVSRRYWRSLLQLRPELSRRA